MPIPAILVQLAVTAATAVVSYALAPKPEDAVTANRMGRPAARDGMVIPVVFGPATLRDSCVLGFGDTSTHEIIANGGK